MSRSASTVRRRRRCTGRPIDAETPLVLRTGDGAVRQCRMAGLCRRAVSMVILNVLIRYWQHRRRRDRVGESWTGAHRSVRTGALACGEIGRNPWNVVADLIRTRRSLRAPIDVKGALDRVPVGDGRAERHHHGVRHTHHLVLRWANRRDGEPDRLVRCRQAYLDGPAIRLAAIRSPQGQTQRTPHRSCSSSQ